MFLVGLTGGIATGKSTVSKILSEECGCLILDADLIAREGDFEEDTIIKVSLVQFCPKKT